MAQYEDVNGNIVSWIDQTGTGQGNLASGASRIGNFSPPLSSPSGITGTINGSNLTFVFTQVPVNPGSILLFLNGVYQVQGIDYTISGTTFLMAQPPPPNAILVAI